MLFFSFLTSSSEITLESILPAVVLSEGGGVSSPSLSIPGMLVERRRRPRTSRSSVETGRINASSSSEMFEVMVSTNPS